MKIARILLVLILGIALVSGFACGGGEPTATPTPTLKPSPTPTPTSTPPVWLPDGIITPGEYPGSNTYGNYEIHWSSDEQYIYIGMRANTRRLGGIRHPTRVEDEGCGYDIWFCPR